MSACKLSAPFSVLQKMAPIACTPAKTCGCRWPFNVDSFSSRNSFDILFRFIRTVESFQSSTWGTSRWSNTRKWIFSNFVVQ